MKEKYKISMVLPIIIAIVFLFLSPPFIYIGIIMLLILLIYMLFTKLIKPKAGNESEDRLLEFSKKEFEYYNKLPSIVYRTKEDYYENLSFLNTIKKSPNEDIIEKLNIDAEIQEVTINDTGYYVYSYKIEDNIKCFSFFEINGRYLPVKNVERSCVSLIFIDNYEDVMEVLEESLRPLVIALIDRKINAFAQSAEGIVRKFEKDRYIFIFENSKLQQMTENKFEILTEIREIDMSNKLPFTLSLGIGINGKSLHQNMEYARAAMDLALGRGGDQALIKEGESYRFFGGKTREVETSSGVRARVKAYALVELINEASEVLIMGHRNADLDCLGADVGIYKIAGVYGKKAHIVLNKVSTSIKALYDKLIDISPYKENCFLTGDEALKIIKATTLLIVVDSHRPSILECPELVEKSTKTVVIDHHRKGAEFVKNPVLTYHEPYASSTCELVTGMIHYINAKMTFEQVEADALLSGIIVDTKNYLIKTGTKTFEASAYLRRNGADTTRVRMLMQNDMESYKAKAMAVNEARIINNNIAIAVCPALVENPELITAQIADDLLNISGIDAAFAVYFDHAVEKANISARSLGSINVQIIMEKLGGGGHQTAAGAQIANEDMEEIMEKLIDTIKALS